MQVGSVILAAGDSTRMGFPKALLPFGDGTFLSTLIDRHREAALNPVVVLGNDHRRIQRRLTGYTFRALQNPSPELGPLSSLKIALPYLKQGSGFILHPVDHPTVSARTILRLASEHRANRDCIIIPRYMGRKGHPVLFPYRFYSDLEAAPLNEGARFVVRTNRTSVLHVDLQDPGILTNVDTPERYVELLGYPGLTSPQAGESAVANALRLFEKLNLGSSK